MNDNELEQALIRLRDAMLPAPMFTRTRAATAKH